MVSAVPQDNDNDGLFGLPFIQLKNGGIRLNFAGFHAEAGLGGLLDGSGAGGGLHASAGTPWGANAAAGLGGLLSGSDGSTGGGLYARAGLGDGLPAAGAGLGGMLGGRSNVPAAGGLYAGATLGNRFDGSSSSSSFNGGSNGGSNAGSSSGSNHDGGSGANANAAAGASAFSGDKKSPGGHTNIQIVSRSRKESAKPPSGQQSDKAPVESTIIEEVQKPSTGISAEAGLYGAIYIDPISGQPTSKSVNSIKISSGQIEEVQEVPPVPPSTPLDQELNLIDPNTLPRRKSAFARWNLRRRLRAGSPKKQIIIELAPEVQQQENARRVTRQTEDAPPSYDEVAPREEAKPKKNTFFDDAFKIPVSTLNTVNQLLNNHAG